MPHDYRGDPILKILSFTLSASHYLFSHQECNMQPKCVALSTSGQQSDGCRAIHFSNNIGFTSVLVQEALLPELDELQLTITLGKECITLYFSTGKIAWSTVYLLIFLFLWTAFPSPHVCTSSSEERCNCDDRMRPCYAMSNITRSLALLEGILSTGALYT